MNSLHCPHVALDEDVKCLFIFTQENQDLFLDKHKKKHKSVEMR